MSRYILGKPARNHYFYDYETPIERIVKGRDWTWLCGQRRMGKTSILRKLEKEYNKAGFTPLYYDLSKLREKEISGEKLFAEFFDYHEDLFIDEFEIEDEKLADNPAKCFSKLVKKIKRKTGETVIFLWDEAERLIDLENNDSGFLETLRAHIYDIDDFQMIIAGTQRLSELFGLDGRCSSFVSMFNWIPIDGLNEAASRELLCCTQTGGWVSPIPESILEQAVQWCGGHPFILQYLVRQIEDETGGEGKKTTEEVIRACFADLVKNQSLKNIFSDDYVKLTPVQQKILSIACEDGENLSLDKIALESGWSGKEVEEGVEFLSNYGYLSWGEPIKLKYEFYRKMISDGVSKTDPAKVNRIRRSVFISYSHKNDKYLNELKTHMAPLVRNGEIDVWDDKKIEAGDQWKTEIENALEHAKAAVLLISPHFLASEFITRIEIPALLKKSASGGCRILCLYVEHSVVKEAVYDDDIKLTDFQGLNTPDNPLAGLSDNDLGKTLSNIAVDIVYKTKDPG